MKGGKVYGFYDEGVENTQTKNTPTVESTEKKEEKKQVVLSSKEKREEKSESVEEVIVEEKKTLIFKKEYQRNDERNQMIQYAFSLGGWDLVALMECENSTRNPFRQSDVVKNGRREPSFGLCMIDRDFHKNIIDDSRFRNDRKRQVDQCHKLWKGGTKFYGPGRWISKAGMKCSDYVKERFIFE